MIMSTAVRRFMETNEGSSFGPYMNDNELYDRPTNFHGLLVNVTRTIAICAMIFFLKKGNLAEKVSWQLMTLTN